MTKLDRIEHEVESLTSGELAAFRKWFHAFDAAVWDQQLEHDALSGKLDTLRQEATTEHQAQRTREL